MSIENPSEHFMILGPDETVGREFGCVVFEPITADFGLTPGEKKELNGMSHGLRPADYAQREQLSPHTSTARRKTILAKTQSSTSAEAIMKGFLTGDLEFTVDPNIIRPNLTPAVLHVLGFIATGYKNQEIAQNRGTSIETVKSQVKRAIWELWATNRYHTTRKSLEASAFIISASGEA